MWLCKFSLVSLFDLLRGRWWNVVISYEAAKSAALRNQNQEFIANQYLFHNSNWLYRPLWTYEAAFKGAEIIFYFYATNVETFQKIGKEFIQANSWQLVNWPKYLVWDQYQVEFIKKMDVNHPNIEIVGPVWFVATSTDVINIQKNSIAVFDVQPVRNSIYQTLGVDMEYYVFNNVNQFLSDIYQVVCKCNKKVAFKKKREIGAVAHPIYRNHLKSFEEQANFISLDPNLSANEIIQNCCAVISMPFTSTALIAKQMGKPTVFYDPFGLIFKDDLAAHGIQVIIGKDELYHWINNILE
jgi:polysaccharide biosynthesis PFTS motif protein